MIMHKRMWNRKLTSQDSKSNNMLAFYWSLVFQNTDYIPSTILLTLVDPETYGINWQFCLEIHIHFRLSSSRHMLRHMPALCPWEYFSPSSSLRCLILKAEITVEGRMGSYCIKGTEFQFWKIKKI